MIRMFHYCLLLSAAFFSLQASATGSNPPYFIPEVRLDVTNVESLRSGASVFFSNCIACHSIKFMRYKRLADDLGYSKEDILASGIMPEDRKITDSIVTNLPEQAALSAYGIVPPDLSLKTREKGTAWTHAFLTNFYEDKNSKTGFNNAVFKGAAMPNLLIGQQGILEPIYSLDTDGKKQLTGLKQKSPGALSQKEFYNQMRDLVAFLDYVSEPSQLDRYSLAPWIFLFLIGLLILCYMYKREVWKEVE